MPVVVASAVVEASVAVVDTSFWVAVVEALPAVLSVVVADSVSCLASRLAIASRRSGPKAGAASVPSKNRDTIKVNIVDHRILTGFLQMQLVLNGK